jgi:hypothetical protein
MNLLAPSWSIGVAQTMDHNQGLSSIKGHASIQNIRRGHYELGTDTNQHLRIIAAFDELADVI